MARNVGQGRCSARPVSWSCRKASNRRSWSRPSRLPPAGISRRPATSPAIAARMSGKAPAGDGAQHRGAEQHRLLARGDERPAGRSRRPASGAPADARPGAAADHDAPRPARRWRGLRLDDLAQAVAEAAEAGDIERDEAVEVALHAQARDHARAPAGRRRARGCRGTRARHAGRRPGARRPTGSPAAATARVGQPFRQRLARRPAASAAAPAAAGCRSSSWSMAAPAADWPPSFSQAPGTIAE